MTNQFEYTKEEVKTPEGAERTRPGRTYVPRVDIYETETEFVLLADLPGVDENSLDITLENDVLTLNGQVNFEPPQGYDLAHVEYGIGDFHRTFAISDKIDRDKIEATIKHGVLRLVMPKKTGPSTRKINVKSA
ncbi:MAG: Hsp20/alpha crystallin family protein [Chloroflexi bacterium]|nr:MAG: Hsp20/alpha crystallin family protein [Chloroflexota bacterium]